MEENKDKKDTITELDTWLEFQKAVDDFKKALENFRSFSTRVIEIPEECWKSKV